jgi:hypothetical protein
VSLRNRAALLEKMSRFWAAVKNVAVSIDAIQVRKNHHS